MPVLTCSACEGPFDIEKEGGTHGTIGSFINVAFCPTCLVGIVEMVEERYFAREGFGEEVCPLCGRERLDRH